MDWEGTGASGRLLGSGLAAGCAASHLHGHPGPFPLVLAPGASFPWVLECPSCRAELPSLLVTHPQPLLVGQHAASTQAEPWGPPPLREHREVPGRPSRGPLSSWTPDLLACPALSKAPWRLCRFASLCGPLLYRVFDSLKVCGHSVSSESVGAIFPTASIRSLLVSTVGLPRWCWW